MGTIYKSGVNYSGGGGGGIPDPTQKSAGQILRFDGTDWVADNGKLVTYSGTGNNGVRVQCSQQGDNVDFVADTDEYAGYNGTAVSTTSQQIAVYKRKASDSSLELKATYLPEEDTGWHLVTELDPNAEMPFVYRKKNGVVYVQVSVAVSQITNPTFTAGEVRTIATLPAGYRPAAGYATNMGLADGSKLFEIFIDYAAGLVKLRSVEATTITTSINCSLSYPV